MSTIITRNSATSGSTPSSLIQGELAINVTDNRLFYGSGSGNVVKEFGLTSSFALSASYAATASLAPLYLPLTGGTISGNVTVLGTASINTLIVNQIGYSSGSNQLGDAANDTQTLYGSVIIPTGSLTVTGSVIATSFTGSFSGSVVAPGSTTQIVFNSGSVLGTTGSFVYSGSRVGIGTPNPSYTLDVIGVIRSSISNGVNIYGDTTTSKIYLNDSQGAEISYQTWGFSAVGGWNQIGGNTVIGPNLYRNGSLTPTARLQIRGSGATSATTTLRIENSSALPSLTITDDLNSQFYGNVGIRRTATSSLDIAGTTRISGSFNTAASGSILTVIGSGSAQPIFTVQGSQGELFSITDSLSGSLFSVNDISGLPILEVFSDNTTLIGNYQDPMLITTAKVVQTNSGSFTLYSLPTASYDTAFFEYSVKSGSNARAGTIMAIQSGSSVNFTETTTTDFGSTSAVSFTVIVTGSNMALTGSSTSGAWTIKTIVRGL